MKNLNKIIKQPLIYIGYNKINHNGNKIYFCLRVRKVFGICFYDKGIRGNIFGFWWGY